MDVKTKSNTEIFQQMIIKSFSLQKTMFRTLQQLNQNVMDSNQGKPMTEAVVRNLIQINNFPSLSKNSRSFKEIADGLLKQIEFLNGEGFFSKGPQFKEVRPVSILKN